MFAKRSKDSSPTGLAAAPAGGAAAGDRLRDLGRWAEAVVAYRAYLAGHPQDFGILVQLGNCAKECADYLTAHQAYADALELQPEDADLHLQMGHLFKLMGRRRDARLAYGEAMRLDPVNLAAQRELEVMRAHGADQFHLPLNKLDLISAGSLAELLELAARPSDHPDPFVAYGELIDSQ